jgi:hypothetical protein
MDNEEAKAHATMVKSGQDNNALGVKDRPLGFQYFTLIIKGA